MSTYQETLICRLQLSRSVAEAEAEEGLADDLSDELQETQKEEVIWIILGKIFLTAPHLIASISSYVALDLIHTWFHGNSVLSSNQFPGHGTSQ